MSQTSVALIMRPSTCSWLAQLPDHASTRGRLPTSRWDLGGEAGKGQLGVQLTKPKHIPQGQKESRVLYAVSTNTLG